MSFQSGSVCYCGPIDSTIDVHEVHQLNSDIESLVAFRGTIKATCDGYHPENWVGPYHLAVNQFKWRAGAKTIIHIEDAPAHGRAYFRSVNHEEESPELRPLIETVSKRDILMSCIGLNGGGVASFNVCHDIYKAAGGS